MVDVARVLAFQYPNADPRLDYTVADKSDGAGPYLERWSAALGARPSAADLATIAASAGFLAWNTAAAAQGRDDASHPERTALRAAAGQAVADIEAFLAIASPTAAQVSAAVRRLAQMMEAVINRLGQID